MTQYGLDDVRERYLCGGLRVDIGIRWCWTRPTSAVAHAMSLHRVVRSRYRFLLTVAVVCVASWTFVSTLAKVLVKRKLEPRVRGRVVRAGDHEVRHAQLDATPYHRDMQNLHA